MDLPLTVRDVVSHELRTPLTIIQLGVDLLGSKDVEPGFQSEIIESAESAVRRLLEIVRVAETVAEAWVEPEAGDSATLMPSLALVAALVAYSGSPGASGAASPSISAKSDVSRRGLVR